MKTDAEFRSFIVGSVIRELKDWKRNRLRITNHLIEGILFLGISQIYTLATTYGYVSNYEEYNRKIRAIGLSSIRKDVEKIYGKY